MIKINLLGVAPPTVAEFRPPTSTAFQVTVFVCAMVVCFGAVGLVYKILSGAVAQERQNLAREQAEERRLAAIKAENDRYRLQLQQLEMRINTIQKLQASRVGPVEHMTAVDQVVNLTTDLYLYTLSAQGSRTALRGQVGSVESMARFLSALKSSGYFDDVQLRQFYQDDQQNRLTYKFSLDYVFKSPTAAAAGSGQAPTPAGAGGAARRAGE